MINRSWSKVRADLVGVNPPAIFGRFVDMDGKLSPFDAPLWKLPTVLTYTATGRTAWLMGVKAGVMPKPVKIPGTRSVAWRANDVREWVGGLK